VALRRVVRLLLLALAFGGIEDRLLCRCCICQQQRRSENQRLSKSSFHHESSQAVRLRPSRLLRASRGGQIQMRVTWPGESDASSVESGQVENNWTLVQ
jgi:hypothetical protein